MFTFVLGRCVASTGLLAADRVGGQMRGDKEWPFNGVTNIVAEFGGRCRKAMLGMWVHSKESCCFC